jgi:hypothetical protein
MKRILLFIIGGVLSSSLISQVTFTNQTELTESEVYGTHATGVVDVNGDGLDDIVALDDGNDLYIWFQDDMGLFTEWHYGEIGEGGGWGGDWAWGMCMADFDKNGQCDLVAGGSYDGLKICSMNDTGDDLTVMDADGFEIFLQGINFFDINYDGFVDIFACHDDGPSKILLNDGNGSFVHDDVVLVDLFDTALHGGGEDDSGNYGSVWSDVNGDNYADCYIAKCRQGVTDNTDLRRINQLWIYDPITNSYSEDAGARGLASGAQSWSADFADIDNDGDMDVFIGNHDVSSQLLQNDGNGYFTDISEAAGFTVSSFPFAVIQSIWRDFDNDGFMDLLVTGGGSHVLAYNNGDNTFTTVDNAVDYSINSFALGDLNSDGFVDIYAVNGGYGSWGNEQPDVLFTNDANSNHWLTIDLMGFESNSDGIGAKVVIEGPFGQMVREVRSGESYGIMNSMILQFGLGEFDVVDNVWVYWPSGIVDLIMDVEADQVLTIEEGTAVDLPKYEDLVAIQSFPNPATDFISVDISEWNENQIIRLTDQNGRLVLEQSVMAYQNRLDVSMLAAGYYTLVISDGTKVLEETKLIKK